MNNTVNLFFAGDFCSKPSTTNINVSEDLRDIMDRFCDFIAQRNPCEKKQQGIIKVGVLYNKLMDTLKRIMASGNAK